MTNGLQAITWADGTSTFNYNGETVTERAIALVLDDDGNVYDYTYGWEAGQNYALHEGMRVVALVDDGAMSKAEAQALYDAERARYLDCWR